MRRLVLLVMLVVLASAPAASSRPQIPATNGWIVFASDREPVPASGHALYRLEPVGAKVTRLGNLEGRSPAWSPDGSRIAFADGRRRLVVVRADGTEPKVLTSRPVIAEEPSWSPDGSRIVFQHALFRGGGGSNLAVINADGGGLKRLTSGRHDFHPAWAPNGSLIAFSSNRGPGRRLYDTEIYVMRPDGRGVRALTSNQIPDFSPAWSPDGSLIAFSSGRAPGRFNNELWTMHSDGTRERRVQVAADPSGFPSWVDESPSWSPDGNWLVYVSTETQSWQSVFIVRPDGTDKTVLTQETHDQDVDPAWQPVCSHAGTAGGDRLRGTLADDRICGFSGADVLTGGAGRDGLYGGDGNDAIRSPDRSFDVVGCGSGRDEVVADPVDLVGVDCERVRRR